MLVDLVVKPFVFEKKLFDNNFFRPVSSAPFAMRKLNQDRRQSVTVNWRVRIVAMLRKAIAVHRTQMSPLLNLATFDHPAARETRQEVVLLVAV